MTTDLERAARRVLETATPAFDTGEARHAHAAALNALRAALPAEGATGARGASDRASDKWRGREEIAARDYWHAHANGQPICEPWLDGWLSRAKAHPAPADAGAAEGVGLCVDGFPHRCGRCDCDITARPACDERSKA